MNRIIYPVRFNLSSDICQTLSSNMINNKDIQAIKKQQNNTFSMYSDFYI